MRSWAAMEGRLEQLRAFDARIAARVEAVRAVRPDWPCRRGCDACCRSLARPLEMTAVEWARVDAAVSALDPAARATVAERVAAVRDGPTVCPYLDEIRGECRIYEARPLACRTYGFFVARDGAEHCSIIEEDVAVRGEAGLVWGN